jgi:hypothetical protein
MKKKTDQLIVKIVKPPKPKYRITVFKQLTREGISGKQVWRWHMQSLTGRKRIVCTSGEPFYSKGNASRAAHRMLDMLGVGCDLVVEAA